MRQRNRLAVCAALVLATALSGCGSDDGNSSDGKKTGKSRTPDDGDSAGPGGDQPPVVTAPVKFSTAEPITLPDTAYEGKTFPDDPPPVTVDKGIVFISRPDGMEIINGHRHSDPVRITPEHKAVLNLDTYSPSHSPAQAPVIADVGGKRLALNAMITEVGGSGTSSARTKVEMMAVDTATAAKSWFVELDLGPAGENLTEQGPAKVVGRSKDIAVVQGLDQVFGVNLKTHKKAWTADGEFRDAVLANESTVAAVRESSAGQGKVVGLDPATGEEIWASPRDSLEPAVYAAGPNTVMAREYDKSEDEDVNSILDSASGKRLTHFTDPTAYAPACGYDGTGVTVCWSDDWLGGFEADTGKKLWELPSTDGSRVAPRVTLVRAGLVYGTTESGPVVLTARTGQDKETRPGIAPRATDGSVGVQVTDGGDTVTSHRVKQ